MIATRTKSDTVRRGLAAAEVRCVAGQSALTASQATNPMKLLAPRARGQSVWVYTSSFGGGLVAGDQTRLEVTVGAQARCFVGTQASTKVYRNPARLASGHVTSARVEQGAVLIFAPDPVQAFADSIYSQRQEFHLGSGAGLALVDWFTSGRAARGERWAFHRFQSVNKVFRDVDDSSLTTGRRVPPHPDADSLAPARSACRPPSLGAPDSFRHFPNGSSLPQGEGAAAGHSGSIANGASSLPRPAGEKELIFVDSILLTPDKMEAVTHRRFNCFATLLLLGAPMASYAAATLADIGGRPVEKQGSLVVSASPVRDGAVLRVAGESVEQLGRELHRHLKPLAALLGDDPWERKF